MTEKKCSRCGEKFLFSEFAKSKNTKDGHHHQCKACVKEYQKKYLQASKERRLEYARKYYESNRDRILEQKHEYYQENRDYILERDRQYRQENHDHRIDYNRKWRKANPDRVRVQQAKRRACRISSSATDPWELQQIALFYGECPEGHHVDHILPLNLGGTHTLDNLQHLEAWLNQSKADKHPDEWNDPRPISCRA